jgi:hypothetical protein
MRKTPLFLLLVFVLAACSAAGESAATETARQSTVVARATSMARALRGTEVAQLAQATAAAQALQDELRKIEKWPILLQDTFDDNALEWFVGDDTGEYADGHWKIEDSRYQWTITAKQGFIWWNNPTMSDVSDFYITVDAKQVSGPENGQVGLIFREFGDGNYYNFAVRQDGMFSLYQHDESGWTALLDWMPSDAIHPNEVNRIGVLAHGEALALAINGQWVANYTVASADAGLLGLMIGMDNEGEEGTFEFDNFEVRVPELTKTTPNP